MATLTCRSVAGPAVVEALAEPITGVVAERHEGEGRYVQAHGPFAVWERTLTTTPAPDGRTEVVEHFRFRLAARGWGALFAPLIRRRLKARHRDLLAGHTPMHVDREAWWSPPERLDARSAQVLGAICTLSVVVGYLGTVITQTITFAADRFGSSTTEQSGTLAAVRVGVLASLAVVAAADRRGRRRLLLASIVGSCATAALGALSPGLVALGVTQTVSRALSTAALLLLAVMSAEEMPAGSRAFAVSVTTLTAALGAGICVWFLPLADLGREGWRLLYLVPLAGIPLTVSVGRRLPESRRFARPHARVRLSGHGRRLAILGGALFLAALFAAPASQLQNEFLRDERGFSAARITLFTLVTTTPAGIGVVIGGRLADRRGRRLVGALGSAVGATLTLFQFVGHGWWMWLWSAAGTQAAALAVPALAVYGPELFPTSLRAKANGILQTVAVGGSSVGLLVAGVVADRTGHLSDGMALLLAGPLLVAVLVLAAFPETAHRELEDINPEDAVSTVSPGLTAL